MNKIDNLFEEASKKKKFDIVIVIDGTKKTIPYHGNEILKLEKRLESIKGLEHKTIQKISSDIMEIEQDVSRGATVGGLKRSTPDFLVRTKNGKQLVKSKIQIMESKESKMNKIDKLFEGAINEITKRKGAKDISGQYRVVVNNNGTKLVFTFDDIYDNIVDTKSLAQLKSKMEAKLGNDDAAKIIGMLKTIKNKKGAFSDNDTDFNIDEKGFITFDSSVNEAATAEYDGKKWTGTLGKEAIQRVSAYIHRAYGLDKVSLNTNGDDVTYDKIKQEFIINVEKAVEGKNIKSFRVPFNVVHRVK